MKNFTVAVGLFLTILLGGTAHASPGSRVIASEVARLQGSLARGENAESSVSEFLRTLEAQGVSSGDMRAYVKTKLSPRELAQFQLKLEASLHGIDPATVTPEEIAQLTLEAVPASRGLSWTGCRKTQETIGLVVAFAGIPGMLYFEVQAGMSFFFDRELPGDAGTYLPISGGVFALGIVLAVTANCE